jgi:hypothetical protein
VHTAYGTDETIIIGLLLPYFDLRLSEINPIIGSVIASHNTAIRDIVPAIAGDTPAISVKKNKKKKLKTLNPMESPICPMEYPGFFEFQLLRNC